RQSLSRGARDGLSF
ncbi:hypothetical protein ACNVD4_09990, partial [Rhizobium sp. BR5]